MDLKMNKARRVRAKLGDLVIARFDPSKDDLAQGRKWNEVIGLVTRTFNSEYHPTRRYQFIHWEKKGSSIDVETSDLPASRFVCVRPVGLWDGNISDLSLDNVEPVE